ncbi:MAG: hypothetical protein JO081_08155 [Alphaproteobacteria bacterium]|nr:hypothetical protein [Alphaproteobacteria bacterium]
MADLTRRSFLQNAPATAATLSVLPAMPALAATPYSAGATAPRATSATSMVIHVGDVAAGEMTLLVGAQEIVLRDPGLAASLAEIAASAGLPLQA